MAAGIAEQAASAGWNRWRDRRLRTTRADGPGAALRRSRRHVKSLSRRYIRVAEGPGKPLMCSAIFGPFRPVFPRFATPAPPARPEEPRVGKEGVRQVKFRLVP